MGLFSKQFANVVEWEEFREDMIFWKWHNTEIKKGSRLILRPGQDAIFLYNGQIEGVFTEDGDFDIESEIIPFLSTLKGFKFGFNSGMRAEVLFVNTKEFVVKWGTGNAINIPAPGLPGGMPIRSYGTYTFRVSDYIRLIDKIAGIKDSYLVENVQVRISAVLDQLLMKWISKEGKDMFNLQANSFDIANGIRADLDAQIEPDGLTIGNFNIMSFSYPKEIQDMINKTASHSMIGDLGRYQQVSMTDAMAQGKNAGGSTAADMAGMMMGMNLANQMMQNTQNTQTPNSQSTPSGTAAGAKPNFCPNCGTKTEGANFCPNCGQKLV
ncbi:MAG TPA: SPFH domain-containing protein [Candidatus Caccomorpha excrementavium]|nr:SPFH domain-containing protein [Candidatus Caccomorpha excrementavium]